MRYIVVVGRGVSGFEKSVKNLWPCAEILSSRLRTIFHMFEVVHSTAGSSTVSDQRVVES